MWLGLHAVTIRECGILGTRSNNCPDTPWLPTDTGFNDAGQIITQATQFGTATSVQAHSRSYHPLTSLFYRLVTIKMTPEINNSAIITRE